MFINLHRALPAAWTTTFSYVTATTILTFAILLCAAPPSIAFAQTAECPDVLEPDAINGPGAGLATVYRRCFNRPGDTDFFTFTAAAGKQYRFEAFNPGVNLAPNGVTFNLYSFNANGTISPVPLSQTFGSFSVVTPPLEARRYGISLEEGAFGFGGPGYEYSFRILVLVGNNLPESAQATVNLSVNPNPVEQSGRLNYTAIATNVGTLPIRGAYFEADTAFFEERLIVNSVAASRGTVRIQNVFGGTNNRIRVNLGTFEPGAKATVRFSTVVRPEVTFQSFAGSRAALFNLDSQGFENTVASDQTTIYFSNSTLPGVGSFTLINAETDQPIASLINGATLRLSDLPTNVNIRVNATDATESVRVVRSNINGSAVQIENGLPYSVCGDSGGNYNACGARLSLGVNTVTAVPYTGDGASGAQGDSTTIQFTLVP